MTLIGKKVVGLGLVLVGGLAAAHGGSAGRLWELSLGLGLVALGALLLIAKTVRRNRLHIYREE
jgi:hypothetical protein